MRCPPEISELIADLIRYGLLRIRALGWSGRADLCAVEADHIHNLPDLLEDYAPTRLAYYWEVERASYLAQLADEERAAWEPLWSRLRPYAEGVGATAH